MLSADVSALRTLPAPAHATLMHLVFQCRLMRDDELLARHPEFDADVKWVTPSMMPKRRLDDHAAAGDAVEWVLLSF